MGDFHLTIATEGFLRGAPYSLPGASLLTNELLSQVPADLGYYERDGLGSEFLVPTFQDFLSQNYAAQAKYTSKTAAQAKTWNRLEAKECSEIYGSECKGLRDYRDVVLVTKGSGWRRADLWNLSIAADELWEPIVPRDQLNTLWYDTQCKMSGYLSPGSDPRCSSNCDKTLWGQKTGPDGGEIIWTLENKPWLLPLEWWYDYQWEFHSVWNSSRKLYETTTTPGWNSSLYAAPGNASQFGRLFDLDAIEISYCLVELRDPACAVALSKPLLLAVILSVFLKVVICIVVLRVLDFQESLVTPGDAIASFISVQTGQTSVQGLVTQDIIRRRARDPENENGGICELPGPRQWIRKRHLRFSAVPRKVWIATYIILLVGILTAIICVALQVYDHVPLRWIKLNAAEASNTLPPVAGGSVFISSVLLANISQLYLSCLGEGGMVSIGTASSPVLALAILGSIMVLIPIALSRKTLPGYMPIVGSNSLAMSAACRVSPLAKAPTSLSNMSDEQDTELDELVPSPGAEPEDEESSESVYEKMALYRLKWGEVKVPADWYQETDDDQRLGRVGHLSFGTIFDDPKPPTEGRWYR
ncbi:hypothetical protein CcaCcLH18_13050 [Colletotrichum camelliae]|nr:hypothetical protein CcaCcLH18_13050 [Colletotrichum camelliae]